MKCDFSGYATRNDLRCLDGRIVRKNAFKINDGQRVPLVWNHQHNSVSDVLGHAVLENREDGVYAYCTFNKNPKGLEAKECVYNGDVDSLSIWANGLEQIGDDVVHGNIREVSLVLAGQNPGAFIESVMSHGIAITEDDDEGIFYTGEIFVLEHSIDNIEDEEKKDKTQEDNVEDEEEKDETQKGDGEAVGKNEEIQNETSLEHSADAGDEKTLGEVLSTLNDEQKVTVAIMLDQIKNGGELEHSADSDNDDDEEGDGKTVADVLATLNDEQKMAIAIMIDQVKKSGKENNSNEEENEMKHNLFDNEDRAEQNATVLSHSDMEEIFADAKRCGSLRDAVRDHLGEGNILAHSIDTTGMQTSVGTQTYGFNDVEMFFPEYRSVNGAAPEWISRNMDWVQGVISGVSRSPFSRIKTQFADITEDEARAKGYIKGKQKKEEVFTTLKRTTDPQTIFKKQKLDRDDIIDITDFDVVSWIKAEMRVMLNEEIARAILIGDGRPSDSDDKIQENHIRPIVKDVPLFNVKVPVEVPSNADSESIARSTINSVIRARKNYKGSGNPTFYTTEDVVTEMLLIEDSIGHKIYKTEAELATALRVSKIVTVEPMEGYKIYIDSIEYELIGLIVNLIDYRVGADKGGGIDFFDDFDIDYNQYKYLIETRMSGALIKPFSAMTVYKKVTN